MPWGVFDVKDDGGNKVAVHVAPVSEGDVLEKPHMLESSCPCQPQMEFQPGGVPLFVHERAN